MRDRHTTEHTTQSVNIVDTQFLSQSHRTDLAVTASDKAEMILLCLHIAQVLTIEPSLDVGLGSSDLHEAFECPANNVVNSLGVDIAIFGKLVIAPAVSIVQADRFEQVVGVILCHDWALHKVV